jgi:hypothetical protein
VQAVVVGEPTSEFETPEKEPATQGVQTRSDVDVETAE